MTGRNGSGARHPLRLAIVAVLGMSACGTLPPPSGSADSAVPAAVSAPDFARLLQRLEPTVLNVRSTGRTRGSGFVVAEHYVVTALHVVDGMPDLTVRAGGQERAATMVARDDDADIALLRVDVPASWRPLPLADSDDLSLGEWLVVIGNPFGTGMMVSVGVVGSTARAIREGGVPGRIQTDASVNPGNSGGPVLGGQGHVIGVATARVAAGAGVGFFTPIGAVKPLLQTLR